MRVELGGGRGWLEEPAAKSICRIDRQIGHLLQITEAGRTWDEQNVHFQTYLRVGYPIALSPDAPSIHQLGGAIDSNEAQQMVAVLNDHGWFHTVYRNGVLVEVWHFEYFASRDNHRNETVELEQGSDGVWRFAAPKQIETTKEQDMRVIARGDGGQSFMDELGADSIGEFFYTPNGPDASPSWVDNIKASWLLAGEPQTAENAWAFDLARHQANARWNRKRAQIVADTVTAMTPLFQLLTPEIDDVVVERAIAKVIDNLDIKATVSDADKAEIARLTVELQGRKLAG